MRIDDPHTPKQADALADEMGGAVGSLARVFAALTARFASWTAHTTSTATLAGAPALFSETLEPARSSAELVDRSGQPLPWRWERSVARDLIGPLGLWIGGGAAAIVLVSLFGFSEPAGPTENPPPVAKPAVEEPIGKPDVQQAAPPAAAPDGPQQTAPLYEQSVQPSDTPAQQSPAQAAPDRPRTPRALTVQ